MKKFNIEYGNNEIIFSYNQERIAGRASISTDLNKFKNWIYDYNHTVKEHDNIDHLLCIGKELYAWLDGKDGWLTEYLQNPDYPLLIEFQIDIESSDTQKAFIEVPWELLANEIGHLAKNPDIKYNPIRRIGKELETKRKPSEYRLNTVFMAASPRHVKPELAFEQEESAILNLHSDKSINMDLFVEESGNLDELTDLINEVKPVDVVHLSSHGNIDFLNHEKAEPYLCLETLTGELNQVTVDDFEQRYSQNRPALIFLSACKTSEAYRDNELKGKGEYGSFAQTLIKHGFSAVLGWSGSVSDSEAIRFASTFYRNLSQAATVEDAVVEARFSLCIPPKEKKRTTYFKRLASCKIIYWSRWWWHYFRRY